MLKLYKKSFKTLRSLVKFEKWAKTIKNNYKKIF